MQTKTIELFETQTESNGSTNVLPISVSIQWQVIENQSVEVFKLLSHNISSIVIEITHDQITTLLDLTRVTPYEVWYFDAEKQFTGKTFSCDKGNGTFRVETQARYIFLWHMQVDDKRTIDLKNFICGEFKYLGR